MPCVDIKVEFLVFCDNAFLDSGNKLNIIGVFDTINSSGFPALHKSMFVVVKVALPNGRYREEVKIKKDGNVISSTPISEAEKEIPGKHQFIHNFLNTVFPEAGEYIVEVFLDQELIASSKLYLQKV